jgi:hypothetical protein
MPPPAGMAGPAAAFFGSSATIAWDQLPSTPDKSAAVSANALEMLERWRCEWDFAAGFSACFD